MPPVSPLAPRSGFPDLPEIAGASFATASAGVRYKDRTDVMLAVLQPGTAIAGVFTRSATRSEAVLDCQDKIGGPQDQGAAILVNSGNANAFTGRAGREAVEAVTAATAHATGTPEARVFTASTGVIGEPLPFTRITDCLAHLSRSLSTTALPDAARAIMTTDTYPKGAATEVTLGEKTVRIAGIAKGSGMIAPDMATMLAYVFTDAVADQGWLQSALRSMTVRTFNAITVDSDTSTSDTLMVAATGASGVDVTGHAAFEQALEAVLRDLSHQVVRDGEGATKFVEIVVTGAASDADARKAGLAVANSPLVKTAIAGEDPNWGRIVMAIGKSGAQADRDFLSIRFGEIQVASKGWVSPDYLEEDGKAYMKREDIVIGIDLGIGEGTATVWTCDLTHGYIDINADYRS